VLEVMLGDQRGSQCHITVPRRARSESAALAADNAKHTLVPFKADAL
jgi:hypothetical protein